MLKLYPNPNLTTHCPACGALATGHAFTLAGLHSWAKYSCPACKLAFNQTLATGHDALFPTSFNQDCSFVQYNKEFGSWLSAPFVKKFKKNQLSVLCIEKKILKPVKDKAIILNTLDYCFGHVFSKIWNVFRLKEKYADYHLIVLIPKRLAWLCADLADELWLADASLATLDSISQSVQKFFCAEQNRFKEIYMANAQVDLVPSQAQFSKLLGTPVFPLPEFNGRPLKFCFIWREDRFWHNSAYSYALEKLGLKYGTPKYLRSFFKNRQACLLNTLAQEIFKVYPEAEFYATGSGSTPINSNIIDLRTTNINEAIEKSWCSVYSNCQLVFGVHGSHMLIPTALSAGFIELVPEHKIEHVAEDTIPQPNARMAHYLGRHLYMPVKVGLVVKHVKAIIKYFRYV